MRDPMLEEIWRVRQDLIKRHGGVHGYLKYLQALDRERVRNAQRKRSGKKTVPAVKHASLIRRKTAKEL